MEFVCIPIHHPVWVHFSGETYQNLSRAHTSRGQEIPIEGLSPCTHEQRAHDSTEKRSANFLRNTDGNLFQDGNFFTRVMFRSWFYLRLRAAFAAKGPPVPLRLQTCPGIDVDAFAAKSHPVPLRLQTCPELSMISPESMPRRHA